jgi:hypothetical protein
MSANELGVILNRISRIAERLGDRVNEVVFNARSVSFRIGCEHPFQWSSWVGAQLAFSYFSIFESDK